MTHQEIRTRRDATWTNYMEARRAADATALAAYEATKGELQAECAQLGHVTGELDRWGGAVRRGCLICGAAEAPADGAQ